MNDIKKGHSRTEFCENCKTVSTFEQVGCNTLECKRCGNCICKYRLDWGFLVIVFVVIFAFAIGACYIMGEMTVGLLVNCAILFIIAIGMGYLFNVFASRFR